ncbi:hypothetical protein JCM19296_3635 [Nonlabens ulvanivorans]|uniref:Uncharacterized protein n=1 Tax=Nonlabens ulvanivorans TaxID=906888 RepID=A0A081DGI0_NONUL|nr:hypothetical protein JCM19296_3635 [Nonlabens ulvanivorans]
MSKHTRTRKTITIYSIGIDGVGFNYINNNINGYCIARV